MHNRSRSARLAAPAFDAAALRTTTAGTTRFRERFAGTFTPDFFRPTTFGPVVSSIGIGTYLGDSTDDVDASYENAIAHAVRSGLNVIDTAINYRAQRSERAVGAAVHALLETREVVRDELVICSKAGYVPLDRTPPETREAYQAYVKREFLDQQIFHPDELVAGGHCLAPRFLRYCLAKSRQNLGLRSIDVYYVHNPEQQLSVVGPDELHLRLRAAFATFEEAASRGEIGVYGCATWDGLRVPPGVRGHLGLEALVSLAQDVAGDDHHFRAVQLPVNLAMLEAMRTETQPLGGKLVTPVAAAQALGLTVVGSASLMQSRLASGLPAELHDHFPWCSTDAQRALAFVHSLPGVTTSLVGMKAEAHVDENLSAVRRDRAGAGGAGETKAKRRRP